MICILPNWDGYIYNELKNWITTFFKWDLNSPFNNVKKPNHIFITIKFRYFNEILLLKHYEELNFMIYKEILLLM